MISPFDQYHRYYRRKDWCPGTVSTIIISETFVK